MAEQRIIAVVGATGAQGGSLARAVLADPTRTFTVRALTRDPGGERARALAAAGAEVVRADLDDAGSLAAALRGAYGAYLVTNYWEVLSPEREGRQARTLAEAAARAGVRHAVWSTLEDTRDRVPLDDSRMPTLLGRYKVPHFDAKGEADRWFAELGVPTTYYRTSFYWENLIHFGMGPQRGDDGVLRLALPMGGARLAGIAAEDIGRCAYGIFRAGPRMVGETVSVAGGHLTGVEMAAGLSAALGEEVRYQDVPLEQYRALGFPGADDLANMFQFYREFQDEFCASRPLSRARELNPALQDYARWLKENASRIPIPVAAIA